jgi:hypothetical protein
MRLPMELLQMKDTHVETLHYRVEHSPTFERAGPLETQAVHPKKEPAFSVRIENGEVKVSMKEHRSTVDKAAVDLFLRTWELSWALSHPKENFEFVFLSGDLIDRRPAPARRGVHSAQAGLHRVVGVAADVLHRRAKYPDPPKGLWSDEAVDLMFERYRSVNRRRTTLNDGAYFCLTVLEGPPAHQVGRKDSKRRTQASKRFGIDIRVLNKIGELTSERGGRTWARKVGGANKPFTPAERAWPEQALKLLIRRAAEVAHEPKASRSQITMADLPSLQRQRLI